MNNSLTLLATFAGKSWLGNVVLNNTLTLLATFAISNSDFEQHSHTFGHFCFEVFARSIKSCPCAAGSPPGPILALEIARQSAQDAPRCGQDGTRSHLLFFFSLSFSFFFFLFLFFSLSLSLTLSSYKALFPLYREGSQI